MSRVPLNFLPTFVAVAQLENLRAAAESLHLTHSAVSQQIAELESRLGFPLFDRRGRRVHLNAAGQALLRHAAPALAQVDDGVQAAAAARRGARPARDDAAVVRAALVPAAAGPVAERHPDIPLEIEASAHLVDLQRDGFHAAIRTGPGPWPGLVHERLYETPTPFIAVAAPADRAAPACAASRPIWRASRCWARPTPGRAGSRPRACARGRCRWRRSTTWA